MMLFVLLHHLEYVHMNANGVRSANAIFKLSLISVEVFTCIWLRFAASDDRFAAPNLSAGEWKNRIRTQICIDFYGKIG